MYRRRRRIGGAAFVSLITVLAAVLAACSPAASGVPPTPGPSGTSTTGPAPTSTLSADARLAAALGPLEPGYTFETTLTVGGQVAAHVTGRRLGTSSELTIVSGGATVTYRIIPPAAWLQDEAGAWAVATDPGSSADPVAPLLKPVTVKSIPGSAGVDQLEATYPASALGLKGTDPITVKIGVASDGSVTVHFETTVGSQAGVSETVFHAAPTQDPIVPPSPLPSAG